MKLCWSTVAVQCAFDKSVHSDVCIKVLWRLPAGYAVPEGSSNFLWLIWKMLMVSAHMADRSMPNRDFIAIQPSLVQFCFPLGSFLCKPLISTCQQKNVKIGFQALNTSKLMQFCWFSTQEVESCWGLCSPNNPAVWCFPFNLVRIAERWCSAVRPRDTQHPSTGNTCRHGFMHTDTCYNYLFHRTFR